MDGYLIFKSLHIIAVISWMAGLLYLPRIFVYHVENNEEKKISDVFKVMEKKLYFYIMTPAMILSWLFGIALLHYLGIDQIQQLWLKAKILLVVILTLYHLYLGKCLKDFAIDINKRSSKFFRIFNEVPTILLILIIFVVIFKPI
tara:strand:+ start:41 stop:475 length:435 start_codon:yes stop_codon:yes gene_type:complete